MTHFWHYKISFQLLVQFAHPSDFDWEEATRKFFHGNIAPVSMKKWATKRFTLSKSF